MVSWVEYSPREDPVVFHETSPVLLPTVRPVGYTNPPNEPDASVDVERRQVNVSPSSSFAPTLKVTLLFCSTVTIGKPLLTGEVLLLVRSTSVSSL